MSAAESTPVSAAESRLLFDTLAEFPAFVLAVSGGPDSTALLWLAARWRKARKQGPRLVAVTVDHGLRPESKREAQAVAKLARRLGVEHRTMRWTGKKPRTGIQEAAREARYRLLAEAAQKVGARHIATAHTLDDQAETVLFRLVRGSGVGGLAGMAAVAGVPIKGANATLLCRPLLKTPKSRLIATLKAAKIPYADDPTNRDPRFARPRLRELMPALAREGLTADRLALLAQRVERIEETLFRALIDTQARIAPGVWPEAGPITIAARAFSELPREIAIRLLGQAIVWAGNEGPVELGKLEALFTALSPEVQASLLQLKGSGRFRRTLAGAVVTLSGEHLTIERAPPRRVRAPKPP